jgi:phosphoglycerate dehydrogenase-like enzyme
MSSHDSSNGSLTLVIDDAPLPPAARQRILELSPRIEIIDGVSDKALSQAHAVYTSWGKFDPAKAPGLRWVQTNGAGVDKVLAGPLGPSRVPMANVKGAYTPAVAEVAIALMLSLTRCLPASREVQSCRQWPAERGPLCGWNCHGATLGIVGYGSIGRHVARVADAMGMKVLACKRQPDVHSAGGFSLPNTGDPEGRIPQGWYGPEQLGEMLSVVDVVVTALPYTPATHHIINSEALKAMPAHAYFVNVGRGPVVDEVALAEALRAGQIAGAGLDVYEVEPLGCDSPLWEMPNVVLTPHIGSFTRDQPALAAEVLIENVSRDLSGRPLINVISRELGY